MIHTADLETQFDPQGFGYLLDRYETGCIADIIHDVARRATEERSFEELMSWAGENIGAN